MEYPVIRAKDRAIVGTGVARKVRELGFIPAVVYGGNGESRSLVVDPKVVGDILRSPGGRNKIVSLSIEGDKPEQTLAIVRDFQLETIKRTLMHCDFLRVSEESPVLVKVPVRIFGKSEAEKLGGVVKQTMRFITIRCPASRIPEEIGIDASKLNMGDELKISQLPIPEGARPVFLRDNKVILVSIPKAEKTDEAAPAEGEAAAPAAQ